MDDTINKRMYPTLTISPEVYSLSKLYKMNDPLRPMISSRGSDSYGAAKGLDRILQIL